ncbi:ABC transporter substrate-binding protein [Chromobacterium violaceum]|uniref:Vitamin B12-binding protein n=1 Tax=Chromobacterium violaceum TaxID=536 RepID=A0AAX2MAX5_CHRVL|nr:ABC transporter substrate-binding protein [Chromobacterium violaceum]STB71201.1 Vitamin B12-binding protein precursor [Chromobacterium violaceum]SUX33338.1 Vitamin B12-binding protein precursor [Chromobacterium violaceum]
MKMNPPLLIACGLAALLAAQAHATRYPLTVDSCNRKVTFQRAPQRAVSHDINLTEMMVALGLQGRMAGYTGISAWNKLNAPLKQALGPLPELAGDYPSSEALLASRADFFFAGWNYGLRVGGPVTPASLAPLGIQVYELSESCAHVMKRPAASLDDVYRDIGNLGRIFDVEPRAQKVVADMRAKVDGVAARVAKRKATPSVFVYDSGEDRPFSAGRLAMPDALIRAAGGRNILADVNASWTRVDWETVVARNPQAIVIIDYGKVTAQQKIAFLQKHPALNKMAAVRDKRFIVLPYDSATPGIANADAIGALARGLHPEAFSK